ncbi:hypothetical protein Ancab_021340, partial [Ancistrocladus abbreviatus]
EQKMKDETPTIMRKLCARRQGGVGLWMIKLSWVVIFVHEIEKSPHSVICYLDILVTTKGLFM